MSFCVHFTFLLIFFPISISHIFSVFTCILFCFLPILHFSVNSDLVINIIYKQPWKQNLHYFKRLCNCFNYLFNVSTVTEIEFVSSNRERKINHHVFMVSTKPVIRSFDNVVLQAKKCTKMKSAHVEAYKKKNPNLLLCAIFAAVSVVVA